MGSSDLGEKLAGQRTRRRFAGNDDEIELQPGGMIPSPSTGAMLEAFEVVAATGKRISLHAETATIMARREARMTAAGRRDPLVQPGPEHPHPPQRGDPRAQPGQLSRRGPLPYPARRDEQLDLRHVGQVGELPGSVLHRERGHDRADPHDGQERDDDLDRVRQLDPDHVARSGALCQQHLRQPGDLLIELRPGQRAERAVQQRLPVQRIGDRRDVAELRDPLAQQRVDHVVGPVALVAVLPDPLRRMQTHLSSLGR